MNKMILPILTILSKTHLKTDGLRLALCPTTMYYPQTQFTR